MSCCRLLSPAVVVALMPVPHAVGQCVVEQDQKIVPSDRVDGQQFGSPVSVDGTATAIGAHHDPAAGSNTGAMYIYRLTGSGWAFEAKLQASDRKVGLSLTLKWMRPIGNIFTMLSIKTWCSAPLDHTDTKS